MSNAMEPRPREPLTARQQSVLEFIRERIRARQYPPTVREIGEHFGIKSSNGVHDHLEALTRKGWISRTAFKSRTLVVLSDDLDDGPRLREARTQAAKDGTIHVFSRLQPATLLTTIRRPSHLNTADYAIVCRDDVHRSVGILPGDWLFIREGTAASDKLVLVQIDGLPVVRRFMRRRVENVDVRLFVADPPAAPRCMNAEAARRAVRGAVVGMHRHLAPAA